MQWVSVPLVIGYSDNTNLISDWWFEMDNPNKHDIVSFFVLWIFLETPVLADYLKYCITKLHTGFGFIF